jgi:hypothetical protein
MDKSADKGRHAGQWLAARPVKRLGATQFMEIARN